MKRNLLIAALLCALVTAGSMWTLRRAQAASSPCATCYGYADCRACKNCTACGHCAKRGGTCGVCLPKR